MEFLMTYGWAILVVLAAIGALAYFGILSPQRFLPSGFTMQGGFSGAEYKLAYGATDGNLTNGLPAGACFCQIYDALAIWREITVTYII